MGLFIEYIPVRYEGGKTRGIANTEKRNSGSRRREAVDRGQLDEIFGETKSRGRCCCLGAKAIQQGIHHLSHRRIISSF